MIREKRPEVYDENFKVIKEDEEVPKTEKEKKEKVRNSAYTVSLNFISFRVLFCASCQ